MHKDKARELGKLTVLKKLVIKIRHLLNEIDDELSKYGFLKSIVDNAIKDGHDLEDIQWLIAYVTELEEL
jgi:hypothetical protein